MNDRRAVYTTASMLTVAVLAAGIGGVAVASHGPASAAPKVQTLAAAPASFQAAEDEAGGEAS